MPTHFTFTETNSSSLTNVQDSSIVLGDIDNDGDLDLILTGFYFDGSSFYISKIYKNDGTGGFTEINPDSLQTIRLGSVVLGDIDNDGDLDLVLAGSSSGVTYSEIYENDGTGSFTKIYANSLTNVMMSSIALGDLDNDGDLDLVLTGYVGGTRTVSKIYENGGTGNFTEIYSNSLTNVRYSSIALGDIDNDNDLDLILTGENYNGIGPVSKIYRNNEPIANNPPSIPSGMKATNFNDFWRFSWGQSTDDHTPGNMLRYQIGAGTNSGIYDYISTNIAYPRGQANIGNVSMNAFTRPYYQSDIPVDNIVFWKVCAIDSAFIHSAYSSEQIAYYSPHIPEKYSFNLLNFPNPFNPYEEPTLIQWHLDKDSDTELSIYSLDGETVIIWKFKKGEEGGREGTNQKSWDGKNDAKNICANGVYMCFLKIKNTGKTYREKIVIVK